MFYTPRGLKIRLPVDYGFALMARLYPRRTPDQILRTVEGLESVPTFTWEITLFAPLVAGATPLEAALSSIIGRVGAVLLLELGLFIVPGLPTLGVWYSYLPSIPRWVALPVLCWFFGGIGGLAAWAAAMVLGGLLQRVMEFGSTWLRHRLSRRSVVMTFSELCFFHAYRLHASSLDQTIDLECSQEELDRGNWWDVFEEYITANPQIQGLMGVR